MNKQVNLRLASPFSATPAWLRSWMMRRSWRALLGIKPALAVFSVSFRACHQYASSWSDKNRHRYDTSTPLYQIKLDHVELIQRSFWNLISWYVYAEPPFCHINTRTSIGVRVCSWQKIDRSVYAPKDQNSKCPLGQYLVRVKLF